jgi:hypothetical protein
MTSLKRTAHIAGLWYLGFSLVFARTERSVLTGTWTASTGPPEPYRKSRSRPLIKASPGMVSYSCGSMVT